MIILAWIIIRVLLFSLDFEKDAHLEKDTKKTGLPGHSWRDSHTTEKAGES
jgi:hypothetical protein